MSNPCALRLLPFLLVLSVAMTAPFAQVAQAAEDPALDATVYSQETPLKALASIIKALDAKDFKYYASHMLVAADKERILKKYESLEKFAEAKKVDEMAAAIKAQLVLMRKLLETNKVTESEENGVKVARFESGTQLLQLEKNADGLWQQNSRVKQAPAASKEK